MNKNYQFSKASVKQREAVHPVWFGIGFILMILIPILGYIGSQVILEENAKANWFPIPADMIIRFQDPYILIKLLITFILSFLVYALFLMITFIAHSLFGPRRYNPPDIPPLQRKYIKKR